MASDKLAKDIVKVAMDCGYFACGMIRSVEMQDYEAYLREYFATAPQMEDERSFKLARIGEYYPWVKSIIICARRYGQYNIPPHLQGLISKADLVDDSHDAMSAEYDRSKQFSDYLHKVFEHSVFIVDDVDCTEDAVRWAAQTAGIGSRLKNSFLYTRYGSYIKLDAWLVDAEVQHILRGDVYACPKGCSRCADSCLTRALYDPGHIDESRCITCLTTNPDVNVISNPLSRRMGGWVYGCDICQDVCPFNSGKWSGEEEYPGLSELAGSISLDKIIYMDYNFLKNAMLPKFPRISESDLWRWKVNALNAMHNKYRPQYKTVIADAKHDFDYRVRNMAGWVDMQVSRQRRKIPDSLASKVNI